MIEIDETVLADVNRGFSVPSQPYLLIKLRELMSVDEPEINLVAATIAQDVAISSSILKTINSPIYGLARSVADIHKSVRYIGLNGIFSLVCSTLVKNSFEQNKCSISLDEFWNNATNIANASVFIGKSIKHAVSSDKLFALGLFHDCGIPVMSMKYHDYQVSIDEAINSPSLSLTAIEKKNYKVNHATMGYYVASSWRLPTDICQLVLSHHDRNFLTGTESKVQKLYFSILKLAENIVHNHKHFRDCNDWPFIQEDVFSLLDIYQDDYDNLKEDMAEHHV